MIADRRILCRSVFCSFVFFFCFSSAYCSLTEKESLMLTVLDRETLKSSLAKLNNELAQQLLDRSTNPSIILAYAKGLRIYLDHPFVEADLGFQKKWYQNMYQLVEAIAATRSDQNLASMSKNITRFNQLDAVFRKQLDDFAALSSNPVRVEKGRLMTLRKEAREKRNEIEKKLDRIEKEERRKER